VKSALSIAALFLPLAAVGTAPAHAQLVKAANQSATLPGDDDGDKDRWETAIVRDRPGPVTLKPDKAYLLVRGPSLMLPTFLHLPSEAEAAGHARRRTKALAKEHDKWTRRLADWEVQAAQIRKNPALGKVPERPQEPTEDNFGFPTYEQSHMVTLGPENRFSKTDGSVYLQEVPPGAYAFYGSGICACLGTVSFEAAPGKVTALDIAFPLIEAWKTFPKEQRPRTQFDLPRGTSWFRITPLTWADPRLPEGSVAPAALHPAGTRPNWNGAEVDRVAEVAGVFRYDRDKQIDLTAAKAP